VEETGSCFLRGHGGIQRRFLHPFSRRSGACAEALFVHPVKVVGFEAREGEMDQFVSTFTNKIDTKGRVSVPASFRTVLAKDGLDGIYCYPSLDAPALDAGGQRLIDKINHLVEDLAPYSDERDQLATALFGTSEILTIDQDGRTILSERLREHAGITSHITFVGLGEKFQLWEPEHFEKHLAESRNKVRDLRKLLGAGRRGSGGPEGARE
jgi:transcriptional regulator MraZ